jgi:internalin A
MRNDQEEAKKRVADALDSNSIQLSLSDLSIEKLPPSLGLLTSLQELNLSWCQALTDVSGISCLTGLQELNLSWCQALTDVSGLSGLTGLQQLNLSWCQTLTDVSGLSGLTGLQQLDLSNCNALTDVSGLSGLTGLQQLDLSNCNALTDVSGLSGLTGLQQLDLRGCEALIDVSGLSGLTGLQRLYLSKSNALTDVSELSGLTGLQHLEISWCDALTDVSVLSGLTGLQELNLSGCQTLTDVSVLSGLTGLHLLDLSDCEALTNVSGLSGLKGLQQLDLRLCMNLTDVSGLSGLKGLQQLDLGWCGALTDISALSGLTSLQQLNLGWCYVLRDISGLSGLTGLRQLDLRRCMELKDVSALSGLTGLHQLYLSECLNLTDVSVLSGLAGLQELNLSGCQTLTDVSVLSGLKGLQQLDLSGCQTLTNVSVLSGLTGLQELNLSGCRALTDVSGLSGLTGLHQLDLCDCQTLTDVSVLIGLPNLRKLRLLRSAPMDLRSEGTPLTSLQSLQQLICNCLLGPPNELASDRDQDNCLDRLRTWQRDIEDGVADNTMLKLLVLGNGRAGKTQICRRLKGEPFDPSVASTHGVSLGEIRLLDAVSDVEPPEPAVDLHFWDFGGQDVYLGTHSLFLDKRAIYMIAWTPELENYELFEQNGVPMRNRPLSFWLAYVRALAGPQAPVIVVQTQCDREADAISQPPLPLAHGFERLRIAHCSAKKSSGMDRLLLELQSAARFQLERYGATLIPANWMAVSGELRRLRDVDRQKTIALADFERHCLHTHSTSLPSVVLEYLHRSGQVFWRKGIFDDAVVLDQAWALDGIYAVLHRETSLPWIKRDHGQFSKNLLKLLIWQRYSDNECELFLGMMEQCQTCFKISEDRYVAPSLLPDEVEVEAAVAALWQGVEAQSTATLRFDFLHEGVLRSMLCGIGRVAGVLAVYWRYGVCFYDLKAGGVVRIRSKIPEATHTATDGGWITVETTGPNAQSLALKVVNSIRCIDVESSPGIEWSNEEPPPSLQSSEDSLSNPPFDGLQPGPAPTPFGQKKPVYVSYGWGGDSEAFVEAVECHPLIIQNAIVLRRDKKALRPGDWISTFMAEIGRADRVLVVLSEKYLQSHYCMQELLFLWRTSLGDRAHFLERIVAVVQEDAKLTDQASLLVHGKYWQAERRRLEKATDGLDALSWGDTTRHRLLAIREFESNVVDMLAWLTDVVMPRGAEGVDATAQRLAK